MINTLCPLFCALRGFTTAIGAVGLALLPWASASGQTALPWEESSQFTRIRTSPTTGMLSWRARAGHVYRVERAVDSLEEQAWELLPDVYYGMGSSTGGGILDGVLQHEIPMPRLAEFHVADPSTLLSLTAAGFLCTPST